jgi:hypothetical protein
VRLLLNLLLSSWDKLRALAHGVLLALPVDTPLPSDYAERETLPQGLSSPLPSDHAEQGAAGAERAEGSHALAGWALALADSAKQVRETPSQHRLTPSLRTRPSRRERLRPSTD